LRFHLRKEIVGAFRKRIISIFSPFFFTLLKVRKSGIVQQVRETRFIVITRERGVKLFIKILHDFCLTVLHQLGKVIYRVRHKPVNTPLYHAHERLVGGLQDGGRGTHVTHFIQLYPQPVYTASQMRTTCRSWDEGVLTDVCPTGVLTDLCLTR